MGRKLLREVLGNYIIVPVHSPRFDAFERNSYCPARNPGETVEQIIRRIGRGSLAENVLVAMGKTDRSAFVQYALERPNPKNPHHPSNWIVQPEDFGSGWKGKELEPDRVVAPEVQAFMISLLCPQERDYLLEFGTGSGYQSMVMAGAIGWRGTLTTVEINGHRAARLHDLLDKPGNIRLLGESMYNPKSDPKRDGWHYEDGQRWRGHQRYDGILFGASVSVRHIKPALDCLVAQRYAVFPTRDFSSDGNDRIARVSWKGGIGGPQTTVEIFVNFQVKFPQLAYPG